MFKLHVHVCLGILKDPEVSLSLSLDSYRGKSEENAQTTDRVTPDGNQSLLIPPDFLLQIINRRVQRAQFNGKCCEIRYSKKKNIRPPSPPPHTHTPVVLQFLLRFSHFKKIISLVLLMFLSYYLYLLLLSLSGRDRNRLCTRDSRTD